MSTDDADPNAAHEGASIASASFSEQDVQLRINNDHIASLPPLPTIDVGTDTQSTRVLQNPFQKNNNVRKESIQKEEGDYRIQRPSCSSCKASHIPEAFETIERTTNPKRNTTKRS